jgi:hypothetical protein
MTSGWLTGVPGEVGMGNALGLEPRKADRPPTPGTQMRGDTEQEGKHSPGHHRQCGTG